MAKEKKEAILIVDDNPKWRGLLTELLKVEYQITSTRSYAEAKEALLTQTPPFHVVIADIRLDDSNQANEEGLHLIEEINEMGEYTNTIIVSGYPTIDTAKKALRKLGVFDYLEKYPGESKIFDHISFCEIVQQAVEDAEKKRPQPVIFISYSHKDKKEQEKLLAHLRILQREGLIDVWSDDRIGAGADWEQEISEAMTQARVAILLISVNFLNSDFILGEEVPTLLQRRKSEGLTVFPVIAKACAWQQVDWLNGMNVRPKNGIPIWRARGRQIDEDLSAIAKEVAAIVRTGPHQRRRKNYR